MVTRQPQCPGHFSIMPHSSMHLIYLPMTLQARGLERNGALYTARISVALRGRFTHDAPPSLPILDSYYTTKVYARRSPVRMSNEGSHYPKTKFFSMHSRACGPLPDSARIQFVFVFTSPCSMKLKEDRCVGSCVHYRSTRKPTETAVRNEPIRVRFNSSSHAGIHRIDVCRMHRE